MSIDDYMDDVADIDALELGDIGPVRSLKPATYTCPLCGHRLHAMSDHVLVAPEGDTSRRRHAHLECVAAANLPGRPQRPGLFSRLLGRD